MRLRDLAGRRVAVWGLGREGWSVLEALGRETPDLDVTVVDDRPLDAGARERLAERGGVEVLDGPGAAAELARFDVVVKSPGVSLYRPEVAAARGAGATVTSATRLFLAEPRPFRVAAVTGTKGKSTTVALAVHLLAAGGLRAVAAGNIGRPALDLLAVEPPPEVVVLEVSSYQAADLDFVPERGPELAPELSPELPPELAVLTNLFPEHLDWHGGVERYFSDKLRLFAGLGPGRAIVDPSDPETAARLDRFAEPVPFNGSSGIHAEGTTIRAGRRRLGDVSGLGLFGRHNLGNLCAALTVVDRLGVPLERALAAVGAFRGLPHRLAHLGRRDGLDWVDDSISTIPQSAVAALDAFAGRDVTLIAGGHDRGVDLAPLVERLRRRPPAALVALPPSGRRLIAELTAAGGGDFPAEEAVDLGRAVKVARRLTPTGGVVLLSPAAPSYGAFRDYAERGRAFAEAAGLWPPEAAR